MFSVSDKVVCIDDSPGKVTGLKLLTKGQVYVVASVDPRKGSIMVVGLDSLLWKCGNDFYYIDFAKERFRLLHDPEAMIDKKIEEWASETVKKYN